MAVKGIQRESWNRAQRAFPSSRLVEVQRWCTPPYRKSETSAAAEQGKLSVRFIDRLWLRWRNDAYFFFRWIESKALKGLNSFMVHGMIDQGVYSVVLWHITVVSSLSR